MLILSALIILPILGVLFLLGLARIQTNLKNNTIKLIGLAVTILNLGLAIFIWQNFDPYNINLQFGERFLWISEYNIFYALGVDGLSITFVLLTAFLLPICILAGWNSINDRVMLYINTFLVLESMLIGVFCAADLLLFYVFFEAVLIPMYIIIGVWGGERRVYASFKFFLYTLFGSVLMLVAVLYLYNQTGTMDIATLVQIMPKQALIVQQLLWLAFFASFAVKVPMWPFHTWLPDAHVQAPTAGSVVLAGVMLKLGGYGFLRLSIPMFPSASLYFAPVVFYLSIIAVVYTSCVALVQEDMKKLIAYSSVAHMGYVTAGLFSFTTQGIEGAVFQMISHGLVSSALFLCVGILYERAHTKEIKFYSGLATSMPIFALAFMVFTLASIGLPGTSGFVGEFMVLSGVFQVNKIFATFLALGLVLGAAYMLWLYKRIMFGEVVNEKIQKFKDINLTEQLTLAPVIAIVIILGVFPNFLTEAISPAVNKVKMQVMLAETKAVQKLNNAYEEINWVENEND
jgi:NADH-quinone oxidoreductase subunit M